MPDDHDLEITLLKAVVALLVEQRETRPEGERSIRTEVLLGNVGLPASEIANLTGKNPAAIRMIQSRARRSKAGKSHG